MVHFVRAIGAISVSRWPLVLVLAAAAAAAASLAAAAAARCARRAIGWCCLVVMRLFTTLHMAMNTVLACKQASTSARWLIAAAALRFTLCRLLC